MHGRCGRREIAIAVLADDGHVLNVLGAEWARLHAEALDGLDPAPAVKRINSVLVMTKERSEQHDHLLGPDEVSGRWQPAVSQMPRAPAGD